jgi:prevent-host-death family protein
VNVLKTRTLPDVRPVSDLRQNMAEVMESIDAENRPVILTKHGRGRYILLSFEEYNRITALNMLYEAVDEGIADTEAGRVSDFRDFAHQLREDMKYGSVQN